MWHIRMVECYLALKINKKEIPTCATTQMNFEDITLSDISQSLKKKKTILYDPMCTRHGEQTASGWVPAGGGWREAGGVQHCGFTI